MKKYFIAGILVLAPVVLTIWIISILLTGLNQAFVWLIHVSSLFFPEYWKPWLTSVLSWPGFGVAFIIFSIFVLGAFAANVFGQFVLRQWDRLLAKIPIVKSIYFSLKQVCDTIFSSESCAFSKALLVQYPRPGVWSIAFLTGEPKQFLGPYLQQEDFISVYLPTTPNPTSGFFLLLSRQEVVELDISVDEALKYIVSMGVVVPKGDYTQFT